RLERGCRGRGGRRGRTRPRTPRSRRAPCARWLPPRTATWCECGWRAWACWTSRARAACWVSRRISLLRGGGEGRQLADVAHVVLDDDGGLEVRGHLLHPLDRGNRRGAVEVEPRHAVALVVLAEVDQVAGEQHRAHVLQPHEQGAVARRVTRHPENDH